MITFTDKIIDENYRNRVKEWEMTQIGKMIFDDGYRAGEIEGQKQGEKQGRKLGMDQKLIELSCRKLRKGKTPETIAAELEEGLELIQNICRTASSFAPEYDFDQVYDAWAATAPYFSSYR